MDLSVPLPAGHPGDLRVVFRPGRLTNVGDISISTGGAVANTGLVLRKLGLDPLFMARIGDDPLGRIVLDILAHHGDTTGVRVDRSSSTSYSVILASPGVDRIILHDPGANDDFTASDVDLDIVRKHRLFHFGYPPLMNAMSRNRGLELRRLFAGVSAAGVVTSLDMSLPDPGHASGRRDWRGILGRVLPFVDIFAPSLDEALFVLRERPFGSRGRSTLRRPGPPPAFFRRLADRFLGMGCAVVLIKAGSDGMFLRSADVSRVEPVAALSGREAVEWAGRELLAPAFPIRKIVNTTGAGDASLGGFLAGLMRGFGPERALAAAVAVGAQSLRGPDASSGIGTWAETLALLKVDRGRPRPPWRNAATDEGVVLRGPTDRDQARDPRGGR